MKKEQQAPPKGTILRSTTQVDETTFQPRRYIYWDHEQHELYGLNEEAVEIKRPKKMNVAESPLRRLFSWFNHSNHRLIPE